MKTFFLTVASLLAIGASQSACAADAPAPRADAAPAKPVDEATPRKASPQAVERWRDWRYGMFIHWGPVSLTEQEISWSRANTNWRCPNKGRIPAAEYDALYKKFDPAKFDAKAWVATAKAAGMKYMVLTVKHCDGFLLWDSKVSDYNIMHTPFGRDVAAEFAKACHEAGMGLGWYFSPVDWRDPDCRGEKNAEFVKRNQQELAELLTNYGKVDILWFDTDCRPAVWDQENTYRLIRRLQPDIMIDERLDLGRTGWNRGYIGPWADFHTPEQFVGGSDTRPWESCMTVSAHNQWAWGGHRDGVKSTAQCLDMLIRCAGANGNMMLNIGPMATGEIAPEQAERIGDVGAWLAKHGESIYGTRGGPWRTSTDKVSTCKEKTAYVHLLGGQGEVFLPEDGFKIVSAKLLTGGELESVREEDGLRLRIPEASRKPMDTVIRLELDHEAQTLPVRPFAKRWVAKATASNIYQGNAAYGPEQALDGDPGTRWAANAGCKACSLEFSLIRPMALKGVRVAEVHAPRIRSWALSMRSDGAWTKVAEGKDMGKDRVIPFKATGDALKLEILDASNGPSISEITPLFDSKP